MSIRASGISRQRREALVHPKLETFQGAMAHRARASSWTHLRTCANAERTSAGCAMMTDENARCNAAMDGAGPAHSEPHDGAECRPVERNPDPPAALLHAPVRL